MQFKQIDEACYYFEAAVNVGYIHKDGKGFLIDAGLEAAAAKKVVKQLDSQNLPLTHLIITHAHADHFGGAHHLKEKREVKVWAPRLEAAIIENPVLEPIYLFQGTNPLKEFRNKFLEGPAVQVDGIVEEGRFNLDGVLFTIHSLPGHSYNQIGIEHNGVLFAADSYFGVEQLKKHKIPYIVDVAQTMDSLEKLKTLSINGSVPGHGNYEEDLERTIQENLDCHKNIVDSLERFFLQNGAPSFEESFQFLCREYDVQIGHASSFLLFRTAIGAYIAYLVEQGKARLDVKDYKLVIQSI
ncbi:MBL fold metallo-hydrolase [Bacillus carboniphilus]|uniref:MBL fold metallo-hydrolase n=1 Tax=Bacillus carboniphilus TaxID=86663 RepID=A0ABP3FV01_9BACI